MPQLDYPLSHGGRGSQSGYTRLDSKSCSEQLNDIVDRSFEVQVDDKSVQDESEQAPDAGEAQGEGVNAHENASAQAASAHVLNKSLESQVGGVRAQDGPGHVPEGADARQNARTQVSGLAVDSPLMLDPVCKVSFGSYIEAAISLTKAETKLDFHLVDRPKVMVIPLNIQSRQKLLQLSHVLNKPFVLREKLGEPNAGFILVPIFIKENELSIPGATKIRRILNRNNTGASPTPSRKVTFETHEKLPDVVKHGNWCFEVHPINKQLQRCFKCQQFGHDGLKCKATGPTCGLCAMTGRGAHYTKNCPGNHKLQVEERATIILKCSNCNQEGHGTSWSHCPTMLTIKNKQNRPPANAGSTMSNYYRDFPVHTGRKQVEPKNIQVAANEVLKAQARQADTASMAIDQELKSLRTRLSKQEGPSPKDLEIAFLKTQVAGLTQTVQTLNDKLENVIAQMTRVQAPAGHGLVPWHMTPIIPARHGENTVHLSVTPQHMQGRSAHAGPVSTPVQNTPVLPTGPGINTNRVSATTQHMQGGEARAGTVSGPRHTESIAPACTEVNDVCAAGPTGESQRALVRDSAAQASAGTALRDAHSVSQNTAVCNSLSVLQQQLSEQFAQMFKNMFTSIVEGLENVKLLPEANGNNVNINYG